MAGRNAVDLTPPPRCVRFARADIHRDKRLPANLRLDGWLDQTERANDDSRDRGAQALVLRLLRRLAPLARVLDVLGGNSRCIASFRPSPLRVSGLNRSRGRAPAGASGG